MPLATTWYSKPPDWAAPRARTSLTPVPDARTASRMRSGSTASLKRTLMRPLSSCAVKACIPSGSRAERAASRESSVSWVVPPRRMRNVFSSSAPTRWTLASPTAASRSRTCSGVWAFSNFTSTRVPPAKSTPQLKPKSAIPITIARFSRVETKTAIRRLPMKSMFVLFLMIRMGLPVRFGQPCGLDGHRLGVAPMHEVGGDEARDDDRREHRGDEPDDERGGKAAHRTGPHEEEDGGRDERRQVRVEDGPERPLVAEVHRGSGLLLGVDPFTGRLVEEDVRIHRHAQRQHEARDARERQGGVEKGQSGEE